MNKILIINAGSSSIKFKLYNFNDNQIILFGICDAIGLDNSFLKISSNGQEQIYNCSLKTFEDAIDVIIKKMFEFHLINNNEIIAIGHRIVHGGNITKNQEITQELLDEINKFSKFAPLHNPIQIKVYEILKSRFPNAKNYAFFDTVFHSTIPPINHRYAINDDWYKNDNIKKYGFHGNSYAYVLQRMQTILDKKKLNLIVLHLGNGSSICTIKNSQSFNTSMGFSPLDGLIMGTRSGDISSSIIYHMIVNKQKTIDEIFSILNKQSGLLAICNNSDLRQVENNFDNPDVMIGFEMFIKRIVDYLVVAINELENKVDAIVFCGGIGENSKICHKAIIDRVKITNLAYKQYDINDDYFKISSDESSIPIFVVKTNEEKYMHDEIVKFIK